MENERYSRFTGKVLEAAIASALTQMEQEGPHREPVPLEGGLWKYPIGKDGWMVVNEQAHLEIGRQAEELLRERTEPKGQPIAIIDPELHGHSFERHGMGYGDLIVQHNPALDGPLHLPYRVRPELPLDLTPVTYELTGQKKHRLGHNNRKVKPRKKARNHRPRRKKR